MRTALFVALVLIFAGTAHAQVSSQNVGASGSINADRSGTLSSRGAASSTSSDSLDATVNANSKNPGEFVPSKYASYTDALATAKLEAEMRPMTVAEAARMSQERKRNANDKAVIQVDEDDHGKLVIASVEK